MDLSGLIEKSGLTAEQFFALEMPTEAGQESVTIGQAKDAAKGNAALATRQAEAEVKFRDRENEILGKVRDAQALFDALPAQARTPEIMAALGQQQEQTLARERQMLVQAMPGWSNPDVAQAEQLQVVELMRGYGYTDAEIGNRNDHRDIKLFRDFAHIRALIKGTEGKRTRATANRRSQGERPKGNLSSIGADLKAGRINQQQHDTLLFMSGLERTK